MLIRLTRAIPEVVAVGVQADGAAFRVLTVIEKFDLDVCEEVFGCEAQLYQSFPQLEADFNVVGSDECTAGDVLSGHDMDFTWKAR
ncbi:MAG: hypothetical protein KKI08_14270 [Armatimonadetes bacterium]|nr:hypothetical protein [Armatimonadota bacterium]